MDDTNTQNATSLSLAEIHMTCIAHGVDRMEHADHAAAMLALSGYSGYLRINLNGYGDSGVAEFDDIVPGTLVYELGLDSYSFELDGDCVPGWDKNFLVENEGSTGIYFLDFALWVGRCEITYGECACDNADDDGFCNCDAETGCSFSTHYDFDPMVDEFDFLELGVKLGLLCRIPWMEGR